MKKTIGFVIAFAMAIALAFCFAGCGGSKEPIEGQWVPRIHKADGTIEHFVADDSAKANWKAYSTGTANINGNPYHLYIVHSKLENGAEFNHYSAVSDDGKKMFTFSGERGESNINEFISSGKLPDKVASKGSLEEEIVNYSVDER